MSPVAQIEIDQVPALVKCRCKAERNPNVTGAPTKRQITPNTASST